MNRISNVLWGIVFVVLGVIFGLNALDITDINIFFDGWWTLFIIVPCFIDLFKDSDKTGNIIGLIIGICLFLSCQDILDFILVWKLMFPTVLVVIGVSFIFRDAINSRVKSEIKKLNQNRARDQEYCATFGEQNIDFSGEEFNGCDLTAVFGGVKCDLRDSKIKKDVVINGCSVFGGIEILVPKDVNVKINATPIFGGVTNKKGKVNKEGNVTIYIKGTCIFGGIDIK